MCKHVTKRGRIPAGAPGGSGHPGAGGDDQHQQGRNRGMLKTYMPLEEYTWTVETIRNTNRKWN